MMSIRKRLTYLLYCAFALLFISTGFGVYFAAKQLLLEQFDETLMAKARALITASEIDDGEFEIDLTVQDFAGFGQGGDDYFEIRRANGSLFLKSPSMKIEGVGGHLLGDVPPPQDTGARIFDQDLADGRAARYFVQAIHPKDDGLQAYQDLYLVVGSPTQQLKADLAILATTLIVATVLGLLATPLVIRYGLQRGLAPLHQLAGEVRALGADHLADRLDETKYPLELKDITRGLNALLERLEVSFERERRFSSHAAHELKTPLAEMKNIAELGCMFPEEATPARCREIVAAAGEMEQILAKLTLLARVESAQRIAHLEEVDSMESLELALDRYAGAAQERGITFQVEAQPEAIRTDRALWGVILQNLVGNAVDHSPPGARVVVELTAQQLRITNPAPGLEPADIDCFGERFWQKDGSRHGEKHSGLGLSIVRACTKLLGYRLNFETRAGLLLVEVFF